mgnify:CR=1 FL=1|tara:strand:- start:122 stop:403 length:282 start_codon:yes stop_codon:yes gene_type:complete
MRKLKSYFIFLSFILLSGCFQSSAILGPGMTIISTGNVVQAGFHYGANTAVKKETGKYPIIHFKETVETTNGTNSFIAEIKQFIEALKEVKKK